MSDSGEYVPTTEEMEQALYEFYATRDGRFMHSLADGARGLVSRGFAANNAAVREAAQREALDWVGERGGTHWVSTELLSEARTHFNLNQLATGEETGATDGKS